jgi:beta-galactosidase
MVEILDEQGRVVPLAENEIAFEVTGEGRPIGMDGGNPQSHDSYKAVRCKAFNGLCLAVVQATAKAGGIKVAASGAGLRPDAVSIVTKV